MDTLIRDLRYLGRSLRSSSGFSAVVILTIAVAVGASTALFSVVNPLLLRAEPFADPDRLVALWESPPRVDGGVAPGKNEASPGTFGDWVAERSVFENVAAVATCDSHGYPVRAGAVYAARTSAGDALREGARVTSAGRAGARARDTLVALELALAMTLLIGAGLTVLSFSRLVRVDPGFDPSNAVTFELNLPPATYPTRERVAEGHDALVERLRSLPGVMDVGTSTHVPLAGGNMTTLLEVDGRPVVAPERPPEVNYRLTTAGFTEAMGMTIRRGRSITAADAADDWRVVTISESAAGRLFPNENPIGRRIRITEDTAWLRVVGVVGDVRHSSLERTPSAEIYVPIQRQASNYMRYVIRTAGAPSAVIPDVRRTVRGFDVALPIVSLQTLEAVVARASVPRRFSMLLLGSFAVIAMVLAVGGVYAMVAFAVAQRTRELAVRVALGAQRAEVVRTVMARGLGAVAVGLGIGIVLALALGVAMSALLYGVSVHEPSIYLAAPLLLGLVAVTAALVPALRASRVDPMAALRDG